MKDMRYLMGGLLAQASRTLMKRRSGCMDHVFLPATSMMCMSRSLSECLFLPSNTRRKTAKVHIRSPRHASHFPNMQLKPAPETHPRE